MNRTRPILKISFSTFAALTGVLVIAAYIVFGGSLQAKPSKRKSKIKGSIPGLVNVGNTCYVNCILQALSSCPSFIRWLGFRAVNSSQVLLGELNKMVQILNNKADDDVACAYGITEALRCHGWVISSEEQDAHELFHAIFSTVDDEIETFKEQSSSLFNLSWIQDIKEREKMEKEVHGNEISTLENLPVASTDSLTFVGENSNNDLFQQNIEKPENSIKGLSIISKVSRNSNIIYNAHSLSSSRSLESPFKGYLASQLICKICGFKGAEQWSTFESLSLSLPSSSRTFQNGSLTDLLEYYVRPELVTDVTCDGCTKLKGRIWMSTFSKQLTIGKLPECLCFHIPRTHWLDNGSAVKRKDFVNIPEILDMAPYTYIASSKILQNKEGGLLGGQTNYDKVEKSLPEDPQSNETLLNHLSHNYNQRFKRKTLYMLQAVIVHVGDAVSGHFVTYRRGSVNSTLRNRWYYTSDIVVKEVSANEVLQSNMYMAIYEKCSY